MVMEKGNFVYSGWRANGFVALVGLLVLIAGGIALCVFGSDVMGSAHWAADCDAGLRAYACFL